MRLAARAKPPNIVILGLDPRIQVMHFLKEKIPLYLFPKSPILQIIRIDKDDLEIA